MRAMVLHDNGIESLKLETREVPKAGPGEIVVRLKAGSLNYRDLAMVQGLGRAQPKVPLVPLSDGAGEVVEVGAGVSRVKVGDLVCPSFFQAWISGGPTGAGLASSLGGPTDGCAQDYIRLSAEGVSLAPKNLSAEEAATLPCAALTAWRALVVEGGLKPGDTVLAQGTGGVSIFALQFAKAAGARVIITSSSDEKLERARALGADATINYVKTPDWASEARKLTGGRGVDHVVEVGGADTLPQSIMAARLGGHVAVIGLLSGMVKDVNVAAIFSQNLKISGITVGSRTHFEDMVRAIEQSDIHPVIDKRFSLGDAQAAFTTMKGASHFGKIVLNIA
ncbi:MAG TPA: NAD(P)-dependent alcohol dehydrogenase [Parvibaculum sp.]|uniref:zinc-dependent alcohol dehydrogenase family protein n=1 Tax=Parvibaculum sp. TaxID=2024848 RepID=UPI002C0AE6B5|nr:NAD(P)-dependent alcohol dehydrogenase [Parvibaculum sp.]HMM13767.1 NAD(P)-dependent alcohol dehydrogenase [Parvibaculum sp.]